jgi:two-component system response regulator AtoC
MNPELAILGPSLDGEVNLKCIHKLKIIDPFMPIMAIYDRSRPVGEVSYSPFGGVFWIEKELCLNEISNTLNQIFDYRNKCESPPDFQMLIGQSQQIRDIRERLRNVAARDITVLITGETGTGKELIARSIHYYSSRNRGPLVKINCGALPDELLESEVFGFQRGAFTDANRDKPGRLEMANGGTLFIDEIGDLSLSLQVKFLQVLEDKEFSRLGGVEDRIVDTRVVAATNADLADKVREGTFRKDLFYRLNMVQIKAPPLRIRREDIPILFDYFIQKYCYDFKKKHIMIPDKVAQFFQVYQWPGNVRELENTVRRAIVLQDWDFVFEEMSLENQGDEDQTADPIVGSQYPMIDLNDREINDLIRENNFSLKKTSKAYVSEVERRAILETLHETRWNRKRAAQLLQVSYKTLLNRIQEFNLAP